MLSLVSFKIMAAALIFFVSLLAGLLPIRTWLAAPNHRSLPLAEAFAGGVFLGAAFFHMLPDATADFTQALGTDYFPMANLLCATGFVILLFLEKFFLHHGQHNWAKELDITPYLLTVVLAIHALSEGTALGVNITLGNAFVIFFAIIVHKSSESLALASSFASAQIPFKRSVLILLLFALMTPLGILLGAISADLFAGEQSNLVKASFNAFAAGTFLYIATLHKVHHKHVHATGNYLAEFAAMFSGLAIMALLAVWV